MLKRVAMIVLCSTFSSNAFASSLSVFFDSLKRDVLLTNVSSRSDELERSLTVRPFNALDKVLSPDASATYNGKINTIKLEENLLTKSGRSYSIKKAQEILKVNFRGSVSLSTVFHEIAHAELDILIENKRNANDEVIMYQYHNNVKDVFKRNFKTNSWTAFHEYFAYYRTDLIELVINDKQEVYFFNGFNPESNKCYLSFHAKKLLAENVTLEEFLKFYPAKLDRNYSKDVAPRYIFVKGKDYDLNKLGANDLKIINETNKLFWMYHLEEYGFPMNEKILVDRMNKYDGQLANYKKCREDLYFKNRN